MSKGSNGNILLTNANIYGYEDADTILIEKGVIRKIGKDTEISKIPLSSYMILDLEGRMVLPGLADAHMHLFGYSLSLTRLDLRRVMSIEELKKKLYSFYLKSRSTWIIGRGWDQENFKEKRYPTRWDLDEVVPDRPVVLTRVCGHIAVVNTKALKLSNITRDTPNPPGGIIGRNNEGEPNGLLYESALDLVYSKIPSLSIWEKKRALFSAINEALSYGLTELHVMSVSREELNLYKSIFSRNSSPIKLKLYIEPVLLDSYQNDAKVGGNAEIKGIKIFVDGSFGARTAALREPYDDDLSTSGILTITREQLANLVRKAERKGLQVALHAIGDRGLEFILDTLEELYHENKERIRRIVRIEHASLMPPDILERIKSLRIPVTVQPHFVLTDWWIVKRLGKRARWVYAYKTLLNSGIMVAASSDAPVEPLNPWLGMYAAVGRGKNEHLDIWNISSKEALTVSEAVEIYTNGKILGGTLRENRLYNGMPADLTILDTDRIPRTAKEISKIRIFSTIVNGIITYKEYWR